MHSHLLIFLFFLRLKGFTAWGPHQNTAITCRPWKIKELLPQWVWEPKSPCCCSCSFHSQQDLHLPGPFPPSLLLLECDSVGNSTGCWRAQAVRQLFLLGLHTKSPGMQPSLEPTQTARPCSILTLESGATNPSSWTRIILLQEASLGLCKVRKMAFKYLQRLHSPGFFCWRLLYAVWATVKCHMWGYQLEREKEYSRQIWSRYIYLQGTSGWERN